MEDYIYPLVIAGNFNFHVDDLNHFFFSKNDFINDFTTLHKLYNLILAFQLYTERATLHSILKKEIKMYTRQQKYTNNNNRQREGVGQ